MKKRAIFFVVCAAVFVIGAVLTLAGYMNGAVDEMDAAGGQLGLQGTVAVETTVTESDFTFDSIDAEGTFDLVLAGSKYYQSALDDFELTGVEAKTGKVIIIDQKDKKAPTAKTEGSKLVISGSKETRIGLYAPTVIVLCGDEELKSIDTALEAGDQELYGLSFAKANIASQAGDIECQDILSEGLSIKVEAGDAEVDGVLKGETQIELEAGDMEVCTFSGLAGYSIEASTQAGEITVGEKSVGDQYSQKGGSDQLKLTISAGDIDLYER